MGPNEEKEAPEEEGLEASSRISVSRIAMEEPAAQAERHDSLKTGALCRRPFLILCYVVELLPAFSCGLQLSYGAIAVPAHQMEDAKIHLDLEMGSWFVSLLNIFAGVGALASSMLSSTPHLGRRKCLFLACSLITFGMSLLHMASSHHLLFVGRAFAGAGVGIAYPASYLFIHETALPTHRASLAVLNVFSLNLGALLILVLGWAFPYELCPTFAALPALAFVIFVWFVPESAVFFMQYQEGGRAKESLLSLWKDHDLVSKEIDSLKEKLHVEAEAQEGHFWLRKELTLRNAGDLATIMVLAMAQACDCLYTYVVVMAKMAGFDINEFLAGIILQASLVTGYMVGPCFIEGMKRKTHYVSSGLLAAATMIILGITVYPQVKNSITDKDMNFIICQVVPMVSFLASSVCFGAGIGSIPYTLLGELLDENVRNLGGSVSIFTKNIWCFLLNKLFPWMVGELGMHGYFGFLGIYYFLFVVFYALFVEETKWKNMDNNVVKRQESHKPLIKAEAV